MGLLDGLNRNISRTPTSGTGTSTSTAGTTSTSSSTRTSGYSTQDLFTRPTTDESTRTSTSTRTSSWTDFAKKVTDVITKGIEFFKSLFSTTSSTGPKPIVPPTFGREQPPIDGA